ncbi:MAG: hypothetical protein GX589_10185 [Deltaproteobacteria bacterium]|nr:hypothetical protein [Deltaproteobacteria bacterium]
MRKVSWAALPFFLLVLLLVSLSARFSLAEPEGRWNGVYIPEQLEPWRVWVLERQPDRVCALKQKERVCVWPGRLKIDLNRSSAKFSYSVKLDREDDVQLPGNIAFPPVNVSLCAGSTGDFTVTPQGNQLYIRLSAGRKEVCGEFVWQTPPKYLPIPPGTALLELTVDGVAVPTPQVNDRGELWLSGAASDEEQKESLALEVFRRLYDRVPFVLETWIRLRVSGRERSVELGKVLPSGAVPVSVDSALSTTLSEGGDLTLKVRAGTYDVKLKALYGAPPAAISPPKNSSPAWPTDEVWVWVPDESLRSVSIEGGMPVDSERTALPAEWQGSATYIVSPHGSLQLKEFSRGQERLAPNSLNLHRTLWLDLDGRNFSVRDTLNLITNQDWRLRADADLKLSRVSIDDRDQLITLDPQSGAKGIELRRQNSVVVAESRLERGPSGIPAVGWGQDAKSLSAVLNLPPGWSLLEATGVDQAGNTLVGGWTLFDFFVLLLTAVAAGKLLGSGWGVVAGLLLVLLHNEEAAPHLIWFHLLASVALVKYLPECALKRFSLFYCRVTMALLALLVLAFSVQTLRAGFYPQIGGVDFGSYGMMVGLVLLIEEGVFGWPIFVGLLWGFVLLWRNYESKSRFLAAVSGLGLLMCIGFVFFSGAYYFFDVVAPTSFNVPSRDESPGVFPNDVSTSSLSSESAKEGALDSLSLDRGMEVAPRLLSSKDGRAQTLSQANLLQNDPKAVVQTGFGMPNWKWRSVNLNWVGAVDRDQRLSLYLLSPWQNLLLVLLRVALLWLLAFGFARVILPGLRFKFRPGFVAAMLAFAIWTFSPTSSQAQEFPPPEILSELQHRLTKDLCTNNCTVINELSIKITGDQVKFEGMVSSRGIGAVAIPGPIGQVYVEKVTLGGTETEILRGGLDGFIWMRVEQGAQRFVVQGKLLQKDLLTIQFPSNPLHVKVEAPDWSVDGLLPTGTVNGSLQFTRVAVKPSREDSSKTADIYLPPWYVVERELGLGMPWKVLTRVRRVGNLERPTVVRLPLLRGETPTSVHLDVEEGLAVINFSREQGEFSWESVLEVSEKITLHAAPLPSLSEEWRLNCSAIWSCRSTGIAPLSSITDGESSLKWRPYPGERVEISVARPRAAGGEAITVNRVDYRVAPGLRLLQGTLIMWVRTSQGGFQELKLPPGAKLEGLVINGRNETARHGGQLLMLPLESGSNELKVEFSLPQARGWRQQVPPIEFAGKATNARVIIQVPPQRWILWADQKGWGPAVLFWSKLTVVLLLAAVLGFIKLGGLGAVTWVLLGLGTVMLPVAAVAVPVLWFAAMQYRRESPFEGRTSFNLCQLCLGVLTLVFVLVLFAAARKGLVLYPEMQVSGGGSSNQALQWYHDFVEKALPQPWIISAPIWIWRVLMLGWAFWAAISLLKWLRWGFSCFIEGGIWKGNSQGDAVVKAQGRSDD